MRTTPALSTLVTSAKEAVSRAVEAGLSVVLERGAADTPAAAGTDAAPATAFRSPPPPRLSAAADAPVISLGDVPRVAASIVFFPPETIDESMHPAEPAAASDFIYTNTDPGVTPPVPVSIAALPGLLSEAGAHGVGAIEMVVTETGEVESVRLQSVPTGLLDIMILHAAKAWRFEPARKNGRPVKYRGLVRITTR